MAGRARGIKARENQLISLAVDCAEKQLREGTASSQLITHYLKLGSSKNELEVEALKEEIKLLKAKTSHIETMKECEERYSEVIKAMSSYKVDLDENV